MRFLTSMTVAFGFALALPSAAQNLSGNDLTLTGDITQSGLGTNFFGALNNTFDGRACIGPACDGTEAFEQGPLRLKWSEPDILFQDSSTAGGISSNDWRLVVNDATTTKFAVQDIDGGTIPVTISGGVPDNTLFLDTGGNIGMGTSIPQADLHLVGSQTASVRMQSVSSGAHEWEMVSDNNGWALNNETDTRVPVQVRSGAGTASLFISDSIGMGTATPASPLHIQRQDTQTDALQGILVENSGATTGARGLLQLRNNGQVYFGLEDTSIPAGANSGRSWNFQNNGGEFRVTTAPGGGNDIEMRLLTNGDLIIEGDYFSNSGTPVPDYVFAPEYDLRPLTEVAAFIAAHAHLPDVPSAAQVAREGHNLSRMQMALLQKVEELTLYTLEQEAQLAEVALLRAQLAAQDAELATLRALTTQLVAQGATPAAD